MFNKAPYIFDGEEHNRGKYIDIIFHKNIMSLIFPQHDDGKKQDRDIILSNWQLNIIDPIQIIKGLIFSDGSCYIDKQSNILKYNFTNNSLDIIKICEKYLDILNIEYKTYNKKLTNMITIGKKSESLKLLELIGTKENPLPVS